MERLVIGSAVAGLACAAAHWFPPTDPQSPWYGAKRLASYAFGTSAILAGVVVALGVKHAVKVFTIAATAGAATGASYIIDYHLNAPIRRRYTCGRNT